MTSDPTGRERRFPIVLTFAALVVFVLCGALGVWQLQRGQWKAHELVRIDALRTAPPQPLSAALTRIARGEDVSFTRVTADCEPGSRPAPYRMDTDKGDWIARALAACRLPSGSPFASLLVDRGFLASSRGETAIPSVIVPPPGRVTGVLYPVRPGGNFPAPYILVVERETPSAPGVTPAPYPDAAENLHYAGAYAPTWFGLAGAVACVYAAMLWRRLHPKQ